MQDSLLEAGSKTSRFCNLYKIGHEVAKPNLLRDATSTCEALGSKPDEPTLCKQAPLRLETLEERRAAQVCLCKGRGDAGRRHQGPGSSQCSADTSVLTCLPRTLAAEFGRYSCASCGEDSIDRHSFEHACVNCAKLCLSPPLVLK